MKSESNPENCRLLVIVPVLNEALHIEECLKSVVENSPESTRILVFDNASSDTTVSLVQSMAKVDRRIQVVASEYSSPLPSWRNWERAAKTYSQYCSPDYVAFLSGNDAISQNYFLNAVHALMESGKDSNYGYCDFLQDDQGGVRLLSQISRETKIGMAFRLGFFWERAHLIYSVFPRPLFDSLTDNPVSKFRNEKTGDWWFTYALQFEFSTIGHHVSGLYQKRAREVLDWHAYHEGLEPNPYSSKVHPLRTLYEEFSNPLSEAKHRWRIVSSQSTIIIATLGTLTRRILNLIHRILRLRKFTSPFS